MADKVGLLYWIVRGLLKFILFIFFRDIEVVHREENVPKEGAVIFVGNHQNQFVDPCMLITNVPRPISFLIAEKSMRRAIVGDLAKAVNSIPVRRAQDEATKGVGEVVVKGDLVTGTGTKFTQYQSGDYIVIGKQEEPPTILQIIDDVTLKISSPLEHDVDAPCDFKIWKKIDQTGVYDSVWNALKNGQCIGIFPEGGSHDRTELLPLKAGVTIMALGAMAKHGIDVKIVPCGLNYLRGYKFRSHVLMEFGKPIEISKELVEKYKVNKREACTTLLENIRTALRGVTMNTTDYAMLQTIVMARRLYQPPSLQLSSDRYLELNRRFAEGYLKLLNAGEPLLLQLKEKVEQYNAQLKVYGITDHQVMELPPPNVVDKISMAVGRAIFLLILFLFSLPGLLINFPAIVYVRYRALNEAKKAKEASTVKIAGRDVIASYKILTALVVLPLIHLVWAIVIGVMYGFKWFFLALIVIQPFASYASLRFAENGIENFKESRPLFKSILYGGDDYRKHLQRLRKELAKEVRNAVNELGPKIFGDTFESVRIIKQEDIEEPFNDAPIGHRHGYKKKDE